MTLFGLRSVDSDADIAAMEAKLGARFTAWRHNAPPPVPNQADLDHNAQGLQVFRNTMNQDTNGNALPGGWAAVAAGSSDAIFLAIKAVVRAHFTAERPLLFSWSHEQKVNNASQSGIGSPPKGNGTAADYVASFRHIAGLLSDVRSEGVLKMCHVPVIAQYMFAADPKTGADVCDPGPDAVDFYGVDHYATLRSGKPYPSHPQLDLVSAYAKARGRRYIIGEWGVLPDANANGAAYWAEAAAQVKAQGTGPGSCFAWMTYLPSLGTQAIIDSVKTHIVADPFFVFR